ncbi:MAG: hypothetical protein ABFS42_08915 [Candidatus Krumholzibacteriota bacterium]
MPADLKLLIRKLTLFFLPFVLYGLVVAFIDPYNFFSAPGPYSDEAKKKISYPLNFAMWKMLVYRDQPVPNLLLGDSRMLSMKPEAIRQTTGLDYYNFAYGGGSLNEAIKTFWFASEQVKLERVCFGINLNNFSSYDSKDRVSEVNALLDNPFLYLVNLNVLNASVKLITTGLTGKPAQIGKPKVSREQFWETQIEVITREMYTNYRYPEEFRGELQKISDYCRENGVELGFLVFPSHRELQDQVPAFGLEAEQERMLADLADLGTVYNFELANEITADRNNYTDPFHFKPDIMRKIVDGVWGGDRQFVEVHGR